MKKTVLLTGANKNLGRKIALNLAELGYNLILIYHQDDLSKIETDKLLNQYNCNLSWYKIDIKNENEVIKMYDDIKKKAQKIDIIINNAAIYHDNSIEDKNAEEFSNVLINNVLGTYLITKYAIPLLNNDSCILNISSSNSINTYYPESIDYDASKSAINSLTHNFAVELSPNTRVNAICPGWIDSSTDNLNPEFYQQEQGKILLKRFAKEQEIVDVILFLISDKAKYINNQIISVDGGIR